jgi:transposase
MRHKQGIDRHQAALLPPSVEDYVPSNHLVRVIDAFADHLNISSLGFTKSTTKHTGRKPYSPSDLLKCFLYGYFNQITSSRRLEKESHRNLELIWLLKGLTPDFKTLCDFRRENAKAIKQANRQFVSLCQRAQLISGETVALDGSKFHGAGSKDQVVTQKQLTKRLERLDQQIDDYLKKLEETDEQEANDISPTTEQIQTILEQLKKKKSESEAKQQELKAAGQSQQHQTESDAKLMRSGRQGMISGYNLQNVVDERHQMIVTSELTQEATDTTQLYPMGLQAKEVLGINSMNLLADAGYSNGEQLQDCIDAQITPFVPLNRAINNQGNYYQKSDFTYLPEQDAFRCPAGELLTHKTINTEKKAHLYTREGCVDCRLKNNCTKSNARWVSRHFNEQAFEQTAQRTTKEQMKKRMSIVEPVFARLKLMLNHGRLRSWGLEAASCEMGMAIMAHNLQRAMNVLGMEKMMELVAR